MIWSISVPEDAVIVESQVRAIFFSQVSCQRTFLCLTSSREGVIFCKFYAIMVCLALPHPRSEGDFLWVICQHAYPCLFQKERVIVLNFLITMPFRALSYPQVSCLHTLSCLTSSRSWEWFLLKWEWFSFFATLPFISLPHPERIYTSTWRSPLHENFLPFLSTSCFLSQTQESSSPLGKWGGARTWRLHKSWMGRRICSRCSKVFSMSAKNELTFEQPEFVLAAQRSFWCFPKSELTF